MPVPKKTRTDFIWEEPETGQGGAGRRGSRERARDDSGRVSYVFYQSDFRKRTKGRRVRKA